MDIKELVKPYSPWLVAEKRDSWDKVIPTFRRPVFNNLIKDIDEIRQIISITGPRRVGKSTLLKQIVQFLLDHRQISPERIYYYSFDDPARVLFEARGDSVFESLMHDLNEKAKTGPVYLLLDEIQTLDRWELYLKKYYDLDYPVRVIISGSATSPIFKKSRESLLGRVKDYHVLPFSFREFLLYQLRNESEYLDEVIEISDLGKTSRGLFVDHPDHRGVKSVGVQNLSESLWTRVQAELAKYLVDGGFPEVWGFDSSERKIEYLYDNQVRKVIHEDLVLATEFRKPEQLKKFYISLLEQPGREVSMRTLSSETGVNVQQLEKYLPLLEMTDLLAHAGKFRSSSVRVRRGNQKFYLVDLALRNAVLRIGDELLNDADMLGLYAENLVFNALRKWTGILQVDYYRDSAKREVDFIVHTRPKMYLPIEVKYRNQFSSKYLRGLHYFAEHYTCGRPVVVTKHRNDFGVLDGVFLMPLPLFLLLID